MLTFEPLTKEALPALAPWFSVQTTTLGDYSLGFRLMWAERMGTEYALAEDCLLLRELMEGTYYYDYPLSRAQDGGAVGRAISAIEEDCRDRGIRLRFTAVPGEEMPRLALRYGSDVQISNSRRWRDYLYRAEDFRTYAGSGYAGQRNHVNKFRKLYPDAEFRVYTPEDEADVVRFLRAYDAGQRAKGTRLAAAEMDGVYELVPRIGKFGLCCGLLFAEGTLIGLSVGEVCGKTMIVHVEKAFRGYEGVYPYLAQQFARTFCGEEIELINRMDDAGDPGLRKSKLQYRPCRLGDKYTVSPVRAIESLREQPVLRGERLTVAPLRDADASVYARLASDVERNRYWGYDWRKDHEGGMPDDAWFFTIPRTEWECRRELSEGIYLGDALIGEVVLHRFGYAAQAEIGARLLPEYEGRGYASEAVRTMSEYAFYQLGLECVEAKCFRENERSRRMLLSAGMRPCGEDERYFYFRRTPAM